MGMSKLVHYRTKCIGCAVCHEMQPGRWRMSRRDGKATLVKGIVRKSVYVSVISPAEVSLAKKVAEACPVRIIKLV